MILKMEDLDDTDIKILWKRSIGASLTRLESRQIMSFMVLWIGRCHFIGANIYSQHLQTQKRIASQVTISLTSQSRLGYAKYSTRNDGRANRTVTSMYRAKMAALAGIAYKTIRRNITTNGNFAVK